ncbi:helix-turn-helix domain-containing protein [Candidatus Woesearchaeota archaeon]|nr:helix-turn-helix domain-containing protein [Candidatus Woesearchaeota archaeon]MBT5527678.1 helix-turn-helix domain-containing protein [Cytophagia bacterium]
MNEILTNIDQLKDIVIGALSPWYTVKGACAYTGFKPTKIRGAIKAGKLKAYREDGGDFRIHQMDLDTYIMFGKNLLKPSEKNELQNRNRYSKMEKLKDFLK